MYYYVTRPKAPTKKITFEEMLLGLFTESELAMSGMIKPSYNTRVYTTENLYDVTRLNNRITELVVNNYISNLEAFYNTYKELDTSSNEYNYSLQLEIEEAVKKEYYRNHNEFDEFEIASKVRERLEERGLKYNSNYRRFYLPKKSGSGLRPIDAPNDELSMALSGLKYTFENMMNHNTYHTSAYAYIPKRDRRKLVDKLQYNKCRWILKTDFSDFFGSINLEFTLKQLSKIFPFSYIAATGRGYEALKNCLKLCFLDDKLPQGTPISPLLTNIIMIPIDYKLSNKFYKDAKSVTKFDKDDGDSNYRLIYTRYADDIFIGSHRGFEPDKVIEYMKSVIAEEEAPLVIKKEKTRYCNNNGQNWILGLMYNKDGDITIGHKKKNEIKLTLANFAMDYKNNKFWSPSELMSALGNFAYLMSMEKDYATQLIERMNSKFSMNIIEVMKDCAYGRM